MSGAPSRACASCRHCFVTRQHEIWCDAPDNQTEPDVVSGARGLVTPKARDVRANPDLCGPDGRWFTALFAAPPAPTPRPSWWQKLLGACA